MKRIITIFVFVLTAVFASAQLAVQKFANTAGDKVVYTYELVGVNPGELGMPDDAWEANETSIVSNFKARFNGFEGVSEVYYDDATNLFTIIATTAATLPKNINVEQKAIEKRN